MAPALVLVAVFLYGVVNGVLQGFGIMPFIGMADFTFEYWAEALTRSDLAASVGFSLYIALVSSVVALAGGIVLSAALCAVRRTRLLALIDVQIPLMCAHILVVLAAVSLFSGSGLVPRILYHLGLVSAPTDFPSVVGDPSGWGILATYVWKEVPFVAFCTVTLMGHVSERFGEAAAAMGASPVRLLSHGDAAVVQRSAPQGLSGRVRLRLRRLRGALSPRAHISQGASRARLP